MPRTYSAQRRPGRSQCSSVDVQTPPRWFDLFKHILLLLLCVAFLFSLQGVFVAWLWLAGLLGLPLLYCGRILWFGLTGR